MHTCHFICLPPSIVVCSTIFFVQLDIKIHLLLCVTSVSSEVKDSKKQCELIWCVFLLILYFHCNVIWFATECAAIFLGGEVYDEEGAGTDTRFLHGPPVQNPKQKDSFNHQHGVQSAAAPLMRF